MTDGMPAQSRRQVGVLAIIGIAVRIVSQTMTLVLLLLAGRFLTVELFGVFVLASILMNFAVMQMYSGIYHYVLREPAFETTRGTTFTLQMLFSAGFAAIILAASGLVYALGWGSLLGLLIAATAGMPILAMIGSWQEAVLLREGDVKFYYGSLIVSEMTGFLVGVLMLANGFGVWSLIVTRYIAASIVAIALSCKSGALPRPAWIPEHARDIIQFSLALYGNSALAFFSSSGADIILGGFLNARAVGLFRMGARTAGAAFDIFAQTFRILTWQAVGRMAREKRLSAELWTTLLAINLSIMVFVLGSLSLLADELTLLLLGPDWLGMVPVLQIVCCVKIVTSVDQIASAQLAAAGQTRFLFRTRLVEATILLLALLLTVQFGTVAVALGLFPSGLIYVVLLIRKLTSFTNTTILAVAKTVWPGLALSVCALASVFLVSRLVAGQTPVLAILITAFCGLTTYSVIAFIPLKTWTLHSLQIVSSAIMPAGDTGQTS